MVNQSHTNYVLRVFIFWGKTYIHHKPSGREPSRWSRSWEQELGPSAGTKRPEPRSVALFKREIYHAPVGWYFSSYWLMERKSLPVALWAPASVIIG